MGSYKHSDEVLTMCLLACGPHLSPDRKTVGGGADYEAYLKRMYDWFESYFDSEASYRWAEFIAQYTLFIERETGGNW